MLYGVHSSHTLANQFLWLNIGIPLQSVPPYWGPQYFYLKINWILTMFTFPDIKEIFYCSECHRLLTGILLIYSVFFGRYNHQAKI